MSLPLSAAVSDETRPPERGSPGSALASRTEVGLDLRAETPAVLTSALFAALSSDFCDLPAGPAASFFWQPSAATDRMPTVASTRNDRFTPSSSPQPLPPHRGGNNPVLAGVNHSRYRAAIMESATSPANMRDAGRKLSAADYAGTIRSYYPYWDPQYRPFLIQAVKAFPPDRLDYKPRPEMFTAHQMILHIAECQRGWIHHGIDVGTYDELVVQKYFPEQRCV